ncbi:DUF2852 domain-containing protein [Methylovirgula sp. HY1]|uniref:DUF2852 domain-containing protein n=1 Tax=Methylovirgula sp. HY1 TaxID=2822761 RepID=UPI001C5AA49E|nr:DUF2852 domain-containing protein [Methylovirgula sp. HY1]QXX75277.1 hypothetical protein MHY1_02096 [Methylovirgula sp. HY1]
MSVYSDTCGQRSNSEGRPGMHKSCGLGWKPIELVAMILGFIVFWPIGLAILLAKIWQKKSAYAGDLPSFVESKFREKWGQKMGRHWACRSSGDFAGRRWEFRAGMRSSGNVAFDEWREAELARLEEERQKLLAAEREFGDFMDNLRRAKDREEFDRFMNARRNSGGQGSGPQPSA